MTPFNAREVSQAYLTNNPQATPEALDALQSADLIIIATGSLHTSLIPALLPSGITDVIQNSDAPCIFFAPVSDTV